MLKTSKHTDRLRAKMAYQVALVEAKYLTGARKYTKELNPKSGFDPKIKHHLAYQRMITPPSQRKKTHEQPTVSKIYTLTKVEPTSRVWTKRFSTTVAPTTAGKLTPHVLSPDKTYGHRRL